MTDFALARLPNPLLSAAVIVYRRWVSPRKGFACPHRVLHGGRSCSQQALWLLERRGAWAARRLMRRRFDKCRAAGRTLAQQWDAPMMPGGEPTRRQRRRRGSAEARQSDRRSYCDWFDFLWLPDCTPDCSPRVPDVPDCVPDVPDCVPDCGCGW